MVWLIKKQKNNCLKVIFMQKYTFFFTIDFWSKPLLKILTFVHLCTEKCVKTRIKPNDQKLEKQMSRSDFYKKIYIFLFYRFLIQAFIENLCTKKCVKAKNEPNDQKLKNQCLEVIFCKNLHFSYYQFLIQAFIEGLTLCAPLY